LLSSHDQTQDESVSWNVHAVEGQANTFHLRNHEGLNLAHAQGKLKLTTGVGKATMWQFIDAGGGQAFIRSHKGKFLQDKWGYLHLTDYADAYEKWWLHDLNGQPVCTFRPTTLYCFSVAKGKDWDPDTKFLRYQYKIRAGIFGCDGYMVISDYRWSIHEGNDEPFYTTPFGFWSRENSQGNDNRNDNLMIQHAWAKVWEKMDYQAASWVVKVEPNTVFISNHIRVRFNKTLGEMDKYYANCGSPGMNAYMHKAFELYNIETVKNYYDHWWHQCRGRGGVFGDDVSENHFFTSCLEELNSPMNRYGPAMNLLSSPLCDATISKPDCTNNAVAFHPFSTVEEWEHCHEQADHYEGRDHLADHGNPHR